MGNSESKAVFVESVGQYIKASEDKEKLGLSLFDVPVTVEDVFEILSPDVIRELRTSQPEKLVRLIECFVETVTSTCETLKVSNSMLDSLSATKLATGVKIMSRILPFINESSKHDPFLEKFWNSSNHPNSLDDIDPKSVGHQLVASLFKLPFISGYTIPPHSASSETSDPTRVDPSMVWGRLGGFAGLSQNRQKPLATHHILMNRIETTRLIMIALTSPLFQSIVEYKQTVPIINQLFVSGDFPHTSDFLISLLVYVLEYETWHYAVPILSNTVLSSDLISPEEQLLDNCLNIINILVDPLPTSNGNYVNVFRDIFTGSAITDNDEIAILKSAFHDKLCAIFAVNSSFKFSITNKLKNAENFTLFIYNLVSMNPRILAGAFNETLLHTLLFILVTRSGTINSDGLIHTVSFILLALSGNREYVIDHMNKKYDNSIDHVLSLDIRKSNQSNAKSNFNLFVEILGNLIRAKKINENLFEIFFTAVTNMAPFVSGFDGDSARTFVWLLDRFSRPNFSTNRKIHTLILLMLETIDNCVHYQYDQNASLIYALIQGEKGRKILANLEPLSEVKNFPIETLTRLLNYLEPRLEEVCRRNEGNIDDAQVVELIRKISVIGILPVPHAIVIRQYAVNDQTRLWFTSYLWGTVFTSLHYLPVLDWSKIRMVVLSGSENKYQDEKETNPATIAEI